MIIYMLYVYICVYTFVYIETLETLYLNPNAQHGSMALMRQAIACGTNDWQRSVASLCSELICHAPWPVDEGHVDLFFCV